MDVVSIQLTNIPYIEWKAETEGQERPITWATFIESFLAKLFLDMAKVDMERQFTNLT